MKYISKFFLWLSKLFEQESGKINQKQQKRTVIKQIKKEYKNITKIESTKGNIFIIAREESMDSIEKIRKIWIGMEKEATSMSASNFTELSNSSTDELPIQEVTQTSPQMQIPGSSFVIDEIIFEKLQESLHTEANTKTQEDNIKIIQKNANTDGDLKYGNQNIDDNQEEDHSKKLVENKDQKVESPRMFLGFRGLR